MPHWITPKFQIRPIGARLLAVAIALGCTASSRADPVTDLNSAVLAAGQQTRAVINRLNDLHASHAGGAPNGGNRAERLRLELDEKHVPLPVFSRFVPPVLQDSGTGPVGSFFSGSARLARKVGRHERGGTVLETPGLTAGADMRIGENSSIGVAGGYVATAEKLSGRSLALYGAHMPSPGLTLDAIAGTGEMSFATGGADTKFGGFGARKEFALDSGVVLAAMTRFNYAAAVGGSANADSEMVTETFGMQASYRIDYLWGSLMPRAGIEHIQELGDEAIQPTETSFRVGLTAQHRDGGILTIDHSTNQAGTHSFRAALKVKF
jgi:hypothetical protein